MQNEKNDQRFCQLAYSEINFSLVAKKPAKKSNDQKFYNFTGLKTKQVHFNTTSFRTCTK